MGHSESSKADNVSHSVDGESNTCFSKKDNGCSGYVNTVEHNGKLYATLMDSRVTASAHSNNAESGSYHAVRGTGWSVAEDNTESKHVIGTNKWGTNYMVLKNGKGDQLL